MSKRKIVEFKETDEELSSEQRSMARFVWKNGATVDVYFQIVPNTREMVITVNGEDGLVIKARASNLISIVQDPYMINLREGAKQ